MVKTESSSTHSHPKPNVVITPASSLSVKSVLLHDWWLVKNHSKLISVAGLASRERLGVREFVSAPISRRIDTTTLETVDGIIITLSGFINRSRTLQNGFPFLVCNDFELGFPYDWKDCVTQCTDEKFAKRCVSTEKSKFDELEFNFDNFPATRIPDLVLHMSEESFEGFFRDHIMGKVANKAFQHSQAAAKSEVDDKTARSCKRVKTLQMNNNDDDVITSDAKDRETEVLTPSRSVAYRTTWSRSSKNLRSKEESNFSVDSKIVRNESAKELSADYDSQLSTPEAKKNIYREVVWAMKASGKQDKELTEARHESSVRRSGRHKIQKSYVGMD